MLGILSIAWRTWCTAQAFESHSGVQRVTKVFKTIYITFIQRYQEKKNRKMLMKLFQCQVTFANLAWELPMRNIH